MSKQFQVVIADPCWSFTDGLTMSDVKRGASSNYATLTTEDIKQLPVEQLADPDGCVLALWVPSSLLEEGLDTMRAWGFTQKQTYIWCKVKKHPLDFVRTTVNQSLDNIEEGNVSKLVGDVFKTFNDHIGQTLDRMLSFYLGRLFRQTHELCLIGINNTGVYKHLENKSQRSVCFDTNLKHSAKPEHLHASLEKMFPSAQRLEIFARAARPGWTCIGNEAPDTLGEDIRVSLDNLINSPAQ